MYWYSFCLRPFEILLKLKNTMRNILTIAFAATMLLMTSCKKESIEPTTTNPTTTAQQNNPPDTTNTTDPDTTSTGTTTNPPSTLTLLQFMKGESDFSIFYQALDRTGIDAEIYGDGPFTIFAPTDEAFQTFFDNNNWTSLDDISANTLTLIVKFHISNSEVKIADLATGTSVPILFNGKEIYINMDDPTAPFAILGLTSADIIESDLKHTNGVIQKINGVLSL